QGSRRPDERVVLTGTPGLRRARPDPCGAAGRAPRRRLRARRAAPPPRPAAAYLDIPRRGDLRVRRSCPCREGAGPGGRPAGRRSPVRTVVGGGGAGGAGAGRGAGGAGPAEDMAALARPLVIVPPEGAAGQLAAAFGFLHGEAARCG